MSVVHYKFRSSLEYDSVTFDGLSISLGDLKEAISSQKKLGKNSTDFLLQVTNAQTKEEYVDESAQIPKNSSVIVRRIPIANAQPKNKTQLGAERADMYTSGLPKPVELNDRTVSGSMTSTSFGRGTSISSTASSEEDKIRAMINQAGEEWDPSKYTISRGRGYVPAGPLPPSYVCYRCGQPGHYIRNCPTNVIGSDVKFEPRIKRNTGIPRTWLGDETVDENKMPSSESLPVVQVKKSIPSELQCAMCKKLLADAVVIPCCGESCCDDCIRNHLLENEQVCPLCSNEDISPDSLVVNKHLRQAVKSFNTSSQSVASQPASSSATVSTTTKNLPETDLPKQQVIKSEADSTKSNETATSKDGSQPEAESRPATVPSAVTSSVPAPSSVPAQFDAGSSAVKSSFNVQPQVRPQVFPMREPFYKEKLQAPPIEGQMVDSHVHYQSRPRMPMLPNVAVRPHPVQSLPQRPHFPLHKNHPVPVSMHMTPEVPRPIPTSVHMDFGPRFPSHLQPMQPIGPGPGFHPGHMHSRAHGYSSPINDIMSGLGTSSKPMSKEEFYRAQRRLKDRPGEKRRKPPRKLPEREERLPPLRHGDFDDELSQYKLVQKMRKRSLSVSSDSSRSSSPDRRSGSFSSFGPSRSATPEGWDRSRSATPSPELRKQRQARREPGPSRESTPSPKRKRSGKTESEVLAKKKKTEDRASSTRLRTAGNDNETRSTKGTKKSSDAIKDLGTTSSKRQRKGHSSVKGESKQLKNVANTSATKMSDPSVTSKSEKLSVVESSGTKTKEAYRKKIKKKHKRKEKKEGKGSKSDSNTKVSEEGVSTQEDEDEFDIVQEKDALHTEADVDSIEKNGSERTFEEKLASVIGKDGKTDSEDFESERDKFSEDDFDIVHDRESADTASAPSEHVTRKDSVGKANTEHGKDLDSKMSIDRNTVDSSNSECKTDTVQEKHDEVKERTQRVDTMDNIVGGTEKGEAQDLLGNSTDERLGGNVQEPATDAPSSVKEQEDEVFMNPTDTVETADHVQSSGEETEPRDELELSVLVGKEDRRDSFLNELMSDEVSQRLENRQAVAEKAEASDTKHKKHKKRDKKHKHKKHKKKHKHKRSKKHKKEKGDEASNAESHATQSDSLDEEEEEPSDDSEMEEVFRGPRSVVVPAAAAAVAAAVAPALAAQSD